MVTKGEYSNSLKWNGRFIYKLIILSFYSKRIDRLGSKCRSKKYRIHVCFLPNIGYINVWQKGDWLSGIVCAEYTITWITNNFSR